MILFAKTRQEYDSYRDFWRLVELAEFSTVFVDEIDLSSRHVFITTMVNDEWRAMFERHSGRRDAHTILWNLERPLGWANTLHKYNVRTWQMIHDRWFDEVWVSDRKLAEEAEVRFVVLGSHPELGVPGPLDRKMFDIVHMSYLTNRRQSVYKHFDPLTVGPNSWGEERDKVLRASRFALNVHQDNHPWQEPLRFALFAAYGLPILSEEINDSYPWNQETMVWDKYPNLVGHMRAMLENRYERWAQMGLRAREMMCYTYQFGDVVREAVLQTTGIR